MLRFSTEMKRRGTSVRKHLKRERWETHAPVHTPEHISRNRLDQFRKIHKRVAEASERERERKEKKKKKFFLSLPRPYKELCMPLVKVIFPSLSVSRLLYLSSSSSFLFVFFFLSFLLLLLLSASRRRGGVVRLDAKKLLLSPEV